MCRSIKPLFNFEPPADDAEIHAAALQFVRKVSGFHAPSQANAPAFATAVDEVAACVERLFVALEGRGAPKNREREAAKARARFAARDVRG